MNDTIREHSIEPVIGHRVGIEVCEIESELSKALDTVANDLGIERTTDKENIRITVGDVDWNESKTVTMNKEVFEELIEWYNSSE